MYSSSNHIYVFTVDASEDIKIVLPCLLIIASLTLIKKCIVFCCIILYHQYGYLKGLATKDRYLLKSPSNPTINHIDLDGSGWVASLDHLFLSPMILFAQEDSMWLISEWCFIIFEWQMTSLPSSKWLCPKMWSRSCWPGAPTACVVLMNSAVYYSYSQFIDGKTETEKSWVCASCKYKVASIPSMKLISPNFRLLQCRAYRWAPCQGCLQKHAPNLPA